MPNWNYATIFLKGSKEDIEKIYKTGFDFQKILPIPDEIDPDKQKIKTDAWYHWCIDNWGTKWNPFPDQLELQRESDDKIRVMMTTAWCLPVQILKFLSQKYNVEIHGDTIEEQEVTSTPFKLVRGELK